MEQGSSASEEEARIRRDKWLKGIVLLGGAVLLTAIIFSSRAQVKREKNRLQAVRSRARAARKPVRERNVFVPEFPTFVSEGITTTTRGTEESKAVAIRTRSATVAITGPTEKKGTMTRGGISPVVRGGFDARKMGILELAPMRGRTRRMRGILEIINFFPHKTILTKLKDQLTSLSQAAALPLVGKEGAQLTGILVGGILGNILGSIYPPKPTQLDMVQKELKQIHRTINEIKTQVQVVEKKIDAGFAEAKVHREFVASNAFAVSDMTYIAGDYDSWFSFIENTRLGFPPVSYRDERVQSWRSSVLGEMTKRLKDLTTRLGGESRSNRDGLLYLWDALIEIASVSPEIRTKGAVDVMWSKYLVWEEAQITALQMYVEANHTPDKEGFTPSPRLGELTIDPYYDSIGMQRANWMPAIEPYEEHGYIIHKSRKLIWLVAELAVARSTVREAYRNGTYKDAKYLDMSGWRIPTMQDLIALNRAIGGPQLWTNGYSGTYKLNYDEKDLPVIKEYYAQRKAMTPPLQTKLEGLGFVTPGGGKFRFEVEAEVVVTVGGVKETRRHHDLFEASENQLDIQEFGYNLSIINALVLVTDFDWDYRPEYVPHARNWCHHFDGAWSTTWFKGQARITSLPTNNKAEHACEFEVRFYTNSVEAEEQRPEGQWWSVWDDYFENPIKGYVRVGDQNHLYMTQVGRSGRETHWVGTLKADNTVIDVVNTENPTRTDSWRKYTAPTPYVPPPGPEPKPLTYESQCLPLHNSFWQRYDANDQPYQEFKLHLLSKEQEEAKGGYLCEFFFSVEYKKDDLGRRPVLTPYDAWITKDNPSIIRIQPRGTTSPSTFYLATLEDDGKVMKWEYTSYGRRDLRYDRLWKRGTSLLLKD